MAFCKFSFIKDNSVALVFFLPHNSFLLSSFYQKGHCANQIEVLRNFLLDPGMVLKKEEVPVDMVSAP